MLNKMPGYQVDKYANLRVGYTFMFGHEGKKLLFMGQEFGQEREWSEAREIDWFLLQEDLNRGMKEYVSELLKLYQKHNCLYEIDDDWAGFEWINADDGYRSIYSFVRKSSDGKDMLLFVLNMTPVAREEYMVGLPITRKKKVKLLLNSDEKRFGGQGAELPKEIMAEKKECDGRAYSIKFSLPAYGAAIYKI